eukprot:403346751
MKSLLCTLPLILSVSQLVSTKMPLKEELKSLMLSSEVAPLLAPSGKTPIVEGFGYTGALFDLANFGATYKLSLDAFLGFEAPLKYYNSGGNNMLFTPKFYVEGSTRNYVQFNFGVVSFRVNLDFIGFKYNFAEPVYMQSIDNTKNYCYGIDWTRTGLTTQISAEEIVNECSYGMGGFFIGRVSNCRQRRYIPEVGLYKKQFNAVFDNYGSYINYQCYTAP